MSPKIAAVLIAAVAALGLSACTASPAQPGSEATSQSSDRPGDDGQSTADACVLVQESIEEATADFESAATDDPATAVEAMRSAAEKLGETAAQVTNDEVAALLPSLESMFTEVGEVMNAIAEGDASKVDDLSELGTKIRETSETFQAVCAG
jgi:hypothetical protein